jgi:3-deoxy-D-manno-octulosonate 8-phosphate phosphatase (KDO 8-P phosphatase)
MSLSNQQLQSIKLLAFDYDGVFTDGQIIITTDGHMLRSANARDGFAVQWARKQEVAIALISGGKEESVGVRMRYLGVQEVHMGSHNKMEVLEGICTRMNITFDEVAYMGDDLPDLPVLRKVGLACCPADAATEVLDACDYISPKEGGKGCVRDVVESYMKHHGLWLAPGHEQW